MLVFAAPPQMTGRDIPPDPVPSGNTPADRLGQVLALFLKARGDSAQIAPETLAMHQSTLSGAMERNLHQAALDQAGRFPKRDSTGIVDHPALKAHLETLNQLCAALKSSQPSAAGDMMALQAVLDILATRSARQRHCEGALHPAPPGEETGREYWRGARLDLAQCDLRGLSGTRQGRREFDLSHSDLTGAQLDAADFKRAKLRGADLSGARLNGADLRLADFTGAVLHNAQLKAAELEKARLCQADLRGADLREARLPGARLDHGDLQQARFSHALLSWVRFDHSTLTEAELEQTDLRGANLNAAVLHHARMAKTNLGAASLQHAILTGADLGASLLNLAQFQDADLSGANLQGALLWGSRFSDSTKLKDADFTGAAFKDLDLSKLAVTPEQLAQGFGDGSVILPPGLTAGEYPLTHWTAEPLSLDNSPQSDAFTQAWRAWQKAQ
ncbi:MAG: pentapeptide repeat-containing protein [Mangrovicoccus sp.]|nr:pentapeptide repeat-containing protein [Mangrovicoccus sp.]